MGGPNAVDTGRLVVKQCAPQEAANTIGAGLHIQPKPATPLGFCCPPLRQAANRQENQFVCIQHQCTQSHNAQTAGYCYYNQSLLLRWE